MILTYKYRLKDRSAKKRLREHAIALNQVWNFCGQTQRECESRYRAGAPKRRWPSSFDLQKLTTGSSRELGTHAGSIADVCRVFAESRDRNKRTPRFRKSFGAKRNLGWVPFRSCDRQLGGNAISFLGKTYRWFGNVRRPLPDTAKGGAFVEDSQGKWWVCFHVEVAEDRPTGNGEVGIDLGLKTLATMSDGTKVENLRHRQTWAQRLASAQRAGNKRRAKAIHARIANARKDHLHKTTCRIARENALIAVGNVNSSRMAKTRMAKSVLDAGWAMFRSQLRYKASRHGAVYLDVDERFTTQTCSGCGSIAGPKGRAGLNERRWLCDGCGEIHDRDVNSAINILCLALSAQRPVEESRPFRISTTSGLGSPDRRDV